MLFAAEFLCLLLEDKVQDAPSLLGDRGVMSAQVLPGQGGGRFPK